MPISNKIKTVYAALVTLAQIYLVYAATLYVDPHTSAILYVVGTALLSAGGALYYIFVQANKDDVGGYNEEFRLDERRRL